MRELPILFSTDMVQAILAGRKTMTRRTKKLEVINSRDYVNKAVFKGVCNIVGMKQFASFEIPFINAKWSYSCPYGEIGDKLWVRETWLSLGDGDYKDKATGFPIAYLANCTSGEATIDGSKLKWRPSIHMRKEHARIFLEITGIRVERLHDISEDDAKAEGVLLHERGEKWLNYVDRAGRLTQFIYNCDTAKKSFLSLWEWINDTGNVHRINPYVWVIEFKVLSTTGRPA